MLAQWVSCQITLTTVVLSHSTIMFIFLNIRWLTPFYMLGAWYHIHNKLKYLQIIVDVICTLDIASYALYILYLSLFQGGTSNEPESLRKLFIGGLTLGTGEEELKNFYSKWGEITGKDTLFLNQSISSCILEICGNGYICGTKSKPFYLVLVST